MSRFVQQSAFCLLRSTERGRAEPNPSLKPSPNSKTPGPRYSAEHYLQRGPGVFLSGPA